MQTVKKAIDALRKKYPKRLVVGYWMSGNDVILNTVALDQTSDALDVPQYLVGSDGSITPTNPLQTDFEQLEYTQLKLPKVVRSLIAKL